MYVCSGGLHEQAGPDEGRTESSMQGPCNDPLQDPTRDPRPLILPELRMPGVPYASRRSHQDPQRSSFHPGCARGPVDHDSMFCMLHDHVHAAVSKAFRL